MRGDGSTACTCIGSRPWRTRSRRSMRFGGTIMSIILTELSRVKAPGNSRKGCSQRPQAHSRSGPRNPVLSEGPFSQASGGSKKPGQVTGTLEPGRLPGSEGWLADLYE
jgi:hypothetical protein